MPNAPVLLGVEVGKEDTNPKDHIFLPPRLMLSEAPRFFPADAAESPRLR